MEWISVDERLPIEIGTIIYGEVEVITADRNGEVKVMIYQCGTRPEPWGKFDDCRDGWITHWMPLPPPPTGKK